MGHYVSLINGMSNAQADDFMSFATDLLDGNSGIVASGDYAVAQSSPVAMSVTVATGKAYIYISSLLSYYRTILDAAATLSIASNSSGSTRIDLICIKIDTGATPDANASNVASVVVVQGTPGGGAPATPANHYKLAEVTVASGAATIVTANIADSRSQIGVRSGVKVVEASLSFADNTTADASTTKHGLLKKLSNVATQFMNGVGAWVDGMGADGWTLANETWSYASATTITVPSGAAAKYAKGDKIKLTQTTVKYFYIVGVADTVLTITGGSDYTLTNAAISANYYSHAASPIGFPAYFNYTPTASATTGTLTTTTRSGRFSILGGIASLKVACLITNKGTGDGALILTLPVNAALGGEVLPARETAVIGTSGIAICGIGDMSILQYNNSSYITNNHSISVSGCYVI